MSNDQMNSRLALVAKAQRISQDWLSPLVNVESTLLLFATFIFHQYYFGDEHVIAEFLDLAGGYQIVIYLYSIPVCLVSLLRLPDDGQEFAAFIVYIGNVLIATAYTSFFWISAATPTWTELLAECYYALQSLFSLTLMILMLTQEKGQRLGVNPQLSRWPGPHKTLIILVYVLGMTLVLERGFSVAPSVITAQVTLIGAVLLNIKFWHHREKKPPPTASA